MNFTSPTFLFYFLPATILIYFLIPKLRNFILLVASGLFYFWGEGNYLFSIYLWILANFITSKAIYYFRVKYRLKKKVAIFFLAISIIVNLTLLTYFKYFSFILANLSIIGINIHPFDVFLPLAVSFLTFHAISYNFDIYRGSIKPESNIFRLILYFTFFPHLIAGPIIRYHQIYRQFRKRITSSKEIAQGVYRFALGLFKKVVIANTLAVAADDIFAIEPSHLSADQAWLGAILFMLQIYYDFSGYTDMAIGLGMIFGFKFPENFNFPYIALSITEFWRRWHMTLSNWIKDYIYIPMGGSRKGNLRTYFNIFVAFSLTGLWHGANWTFLVWGIFHAFLLIIERLGGGILINWMPRILRHIYVIVALLISWILFRNTDLGQAFEFIKLFFNLYSPDKLVYFGTNHFLDIDLLIVLVVGIVFATPIPVRSIAYLKKHASLITIQLIDSIAFIFLWVLTLIYVAGPTFQSFIYFRF